HVAVAAIAIDIRVERVGAILAADRARHAHVRKQLVEFNIGHGRRAVEICYKSKRHFMSPVAKDGRPPLAPGFVPLTIFWQPGTKMTPPARFCRMVRHGRCLRYFRTMSALSTAMNLKQ